MARRRNLSDGLETRFECPVSWDGMQGGDLPGGEARRFCGQCRCAVFDFAQMEPRAVKARLEASRGKLCARVTREQGRIQMLAPPPPPAELPRKPERAGPLAAGIFGAWLSLAAVEAAAAPEAAAPFSAVAPEPEGGRRGSSPPAARANQEAGLPGSFSEAIEVTTTLEVVSRQVTVGMVVYLEPTLSQLFDSSDLVIAGRVGGSDILAVHDGIAEVRTELRVARFFKGVVRDRFVTYRHSLPVEAFAPELEQPVPELTPGSMVVAFLSPADDESGRPVFEAASYSGGVRGLAADELAAYAGRLEELATLYLMAGPGGELDPSGLMEWLVATAEAPATRPENTSREILSALEGLEDSGESGGGNREAPAQLSALLTADQEARLAAALLATPTMRSADLDLFRLVRKFDPDSAAWWLTATLRSGVIPEKGDLVARLEEFAELLDEKTARALLAGAKERLEAADEPMPDEWSAEAEAAWERQRRDHARPLFARLAELLEKRAN